MDRILTDSLAQYAAASLDCDLQARPEGTAGLPDVVL